MFITQDRGCHLSVRDSVGGHGRALREQFLGHHETFQRAPTVTAVFEGMVMPIQPRSVSLREYSTSTADCQESCRGRKAPYRSPSGGTSSLLHEGPAVGVSTRAGGRMVGIGSFLLVAVISKWPPALVTLYRRERFRLRSSVPYPDSDGDGQSAVDPQVLAGYVRGRVRE